MDETPGSVVTNSIKVITGELKKKMTWFVIIMTII
jgi:hypothetical protein